MEWNQFGFQKVFDYHKGTEQHTLYWELTTDKCDNYHSPWSFNRKYYDAIEAFHGECIINTPLHVRDLYTEGDGNYMTTIHETDTQEQQNSMCQCKWSGLCWKK